MRRRERFSPRRFEVLEDRRMRAGDITFANHILTITGDNYDDVAVVRFHGDHVDADLTAGKSNGGTDHHDKNKSISDVTRIVFNGFAGNDMLTVEVQGLDSDVTLSNVVLEFHGGDDDDQLVDQMQGGIKTFAYGDGGRDILDGSRFDDVLEGGAGDDDLHGGGGSDRYVFAGSNLGHDAIMDEADGADSDTLDFSDFDTGVNVNLASQFSTDPALATYAVNSADLQLKLLSNTGIENVIGTADHDVIAGNARNNFLSGGGDADDIAGAGGDDTLDGGAGSDTYYFSGSNLGSDTIIEAASADADSLSFAGFASGVTVNLSKYGSAYAVNSANLKLKLSNDTAIENVYGSFYDDDITGNSRGNILKGFDGNDTIRGGAGADYLYGGNGDDRLYTDALDEAFGEAGLDWFDKYYEGDLVWRSNPSASRYKDWKLVGTPRLDAYIKMPSPPSNGPGAPITIPKPERPEVPEIQH
jgi:Ca2+-binding RTX toxin-like protein